MLLKNVKIGGKVVRVVLSEQEKKELRDGGTVRRCADDGKKGTFILSLEMERI